MIDRLITWTVYPGTIEAVLANVIIGLFFIAVIVLDIWIIRKFK